jgi:hypothetical protein
MNTEVARIVSRGARIARSHAWQRRGHAKATLAFLFFGKVSKRHSHLPQSRGIYSILFPLFFATVERVRWGGAVKINNESCHVALGHLN